MLGSAGLAHNLLSLSLSTVTGTRKKLEKVRRQEKWLSQDLSWHEGLSAHIIRGVGRRQEVQQQDVQIKKKRNEKLPIFPGPSCPAS